MSIPVYYAADVDPAALAGRTVAIIGYGNQGRAHALNLRDSGASTAGSVAGAVSLGSGASNGGLLPGLHVVVGQRPSGGTLDGKGSGFDRAVADGFVPLSIGDAAAAADLVILALPDETMAEGYHAESAARLRPGAALGFVHGFNIHFRRIVPPPNIDVVMVAPKGPGALVREAFTRGGGLACIVATHQDATGRAMSIALAWGLGIGGGRGGMLASTFAAECESDLFGEQAVLCGGMVELMTAAFEILVEAGYPAEVAYIECVHEVKQIVDLMYAGGLAAMRARISGTAAYGGLTRGPVVIDTATRERMRGILAEIRDGRFAAEWVRECAAGKPELRRRMAAEAGGALEAAAKRVLAIVRGAGVV